MSDVSDDLVQRVARAILETDPTCNYDACKKRLEADFARGRTFEQGWWERLHDKARAAIAVVRAQAWQPIETAPKDGKTFVDVWAVNPAGRRYPAVRWSDHDTCGFTWRRWDGEPIVDMADAVATHWTNMPAPPEADT